MTTRVPSGRGLYERRGKRAFDLVTAVAIGGLSLPLQTVIAILVRATLGSPVLFKHERPGLNGESFALIKFRTMTDERGSDGNRLPDEVRLTQVGRILRSTSMDELPELWNVVKGDMSLVGPRPLLVKYLPLYTSDQARRHTVRPGVTGWAQVNGRNSAEWHGRLAMDTWYVDHVSLVLDVRILMKTVVAVLMRRGISTEGHATVPEFNPRNRV